MLKKYKLLYIVILLFIIASVFRYTSNSSGYTINSSIKDILSENKSEEEFLTDSNYLYYMDLLVKKLVGDKDFPKDNYILGDLNQNNIPELLIFRERDVENKKDKGFLEIYMFNGHKYILLDKISMNYDNSNYQMKIGYVGQNQKGIYLNNQVGAHSGMTYGFILENNQLKSILNPNKVNLLSIYTDNDIKDIDEDGILEFSVYTTDPEFKNEDIANAGKLLIWYQWDGFDSANIVRIEKEDGNKTLKENESQDLLEDDNVVLDDDLNSFKNFISTNLEYLDKDSGTRLVNQYIYRLNQEVDNRSLEIDSYIEKSNINLKKLDPENLNDPIFMENKTLFNDQKKLKSKLKENYDLGYKIEFSPKSKSYKYFIDYNYLRKHFKDILSQEYSDYLSILADRPNEEPLDNFQYINKLVSNLIKIESFKTIYPYSNLISKLDILYKDNINLILFGHKDKSHFNDEDMSFDKDVYGKIVKIIDSHPDSEFSDIFQAFIDELDRNKLEVNLNFEYKKTKA